MIKESVFPTTYNKIKNHLTLTTCAEIAELMLPLLKRHGITVFNYYRMYHDGSIIRLSTDRAWSEHFFKKDYINTLTIPESYLAKQTNYYIWLTGDCPEMLLDAAVNFNTSNGISIAEKHPDYVEYFCFATTNSNTSIINTFYINNLDILHNYSNYFREQLSTLLITAEKSRIITANSVNKMQPNNVTSKQSNYNTLKSPLNDLSSRQIDCATLLLKGMTYKEIANALNLSSRTVETHVNFIKTKFNCRNKSELLIKLSSFP